MVLSPPYTRPEAVRTLVAQQLASVGLLVDPEDAAAPAVGATEAQMQASAAGARSRAADAVDEALSGSSATVEQKAERRRALTDEPAVIGKARGKGS